MTGSSSQLDHNAAIVRAFWQVQRGELTGLAKAPEFALVQCLAHFQPHDPRSAKLLAILRRQPSLERLEVWIRAKLLEAPSEHLRRLQAILERGDEQADLILEKACQNVDAVRNLFKILLASTDFHEGFKQITFGINVRGVETAEVITSSEWTGGGLPLLVPVAHAVRCLPEYFLQDDNGYVFYSDAWPRVQEIITDHLRGKDMTKEGLPPLERSNSVFALLQQGFPFEELRVAIESSLQQYMKAWAPFEAQGGFDLEQFEEYETEQNLLQPGRPGVAPHGMPPSQAGSRERGADEVWDLEGLLQIARQARAAVMATVASEWRCVTSGARFAVDAAGGYRDCRKAQSCSHALAAGLPSSIDVIVPDVKRPSRAEQKAHDKYGYLGEARYRRLRDLARLAAVVDNLADLKTTVKWFEAHFKVLIIENRFKRPTSLGWRDMQLFLSVPTADGWQHIVELQVQLRTFYEVRQVEHSKYDKVRSTFTGKLQASAEATIQLIIRALDEIVAPASLQQPVPLSGGVFKLYFRKWSGAKATIGNSREFAMAPPLPAGRLRELGTTARGYFKRCVEQAALQPSAQRDHFLDAFLPALQTTLFDEAGDLSVPGAAFLAEAGAPTRCTSHQLPRSLAQALPHYLKTSYPLSQPEKLAHMAAATGVADLKARVRRLAPTSKKGAGGVPFFHDMEWDKDPQTRGVVFVLQGVGSVHLHHIWSCADSGPKIDGRFFKEANVEGLTWRLGELVEDEDAALGLVATLISMNGP